MSSMGEYGSLLQLGFGIGAGLTVFQAPIELRYSRMNTSIDQQLSITKNVRTDKGRAMHTALATLKLRLLGEYKILKKFERPLLYILACLAIANWYELVQVSDHAGEGVSLARYWIFMTISVYAYLLIAAIIEIFARIRLRPLQKALAEIC